MKKRSRDTLRARNGMRTGKDSRLQRPPSLEPAVSRTASGGLSRNPDFQSKRNPPPFRRWMFSHSLLLLLILLLGLSSGWAVPQPYRLMMQQSAIFANGSPVLFSFRVKLLEQGRTLAVETKNAVETDQRLCNRESHWLGRSAARSFAWGRLALGGIEDDREDVPGIVEG